jgi:hypothetical protein
VALFVWGLVLAHHEAAGTAGMLLASVTNAAFGLVIALKAIVVE